MTAYEIYYRAFEKWGTEIQVDIAIEELAELIQALVKIKRSTVSRHDALSGVSEEMADVQIMLEQLGIIFANAPAVAEFRAQKLKRLEERLLE